MNQEEGTENRLHAINVKEGEVMFLVVIRWVTNEIDTYCVVAETKERAQDYIDKKMEGKKPSGMGYYRIIPIELYS